MKNGKKAYETPKVAKMEFDAGYRITASNCIAPPIDCDVDSDACLD